MSSRQHQVRRSGVGLEPWIVRLCVQLYVYCTCNVLIVISWINSSSIFTKFIGFSVV